MKRILVYGDSIAWGMIPATKFERYPFEKRWPGILQLKLGNSFQIIEENLCARTIDSDDPRPGFEGRNGIQFLPTILDSHFPLDVVIISLGLNEIKSLFDWTPQQVSEKMRNLIKVVMERKPNFHTVNTRILLLSQPVVKSTGFWGDLWVGSHEKSIELNKEYKKLSEEMGIEFVNLGDIQTDNNDGVHIDCFEHEKIAEKVCNYITENEKV